MALISSSSVGAIPRPGSASQKGDPVGLKEYAVEVNGRATTLQLNDEDAKLHGLTAKDVVKKAAVADDEAAAEAAADADAAKADAAAKAAAAPANKAAKQPTNKQAEAAEQALGH